MTKPASERIKVRMPVLCLFGTLIAELFSPTTGSGRSGLARSHSGRRLWIGGSATKFSCGGGEVVAHSSVHAFHGLSPATLPRNNECATFQSNTSDPALMKNTPMVESMFIQPQPGMSG